MAEKQQPLVDLFGNSTLTPRQIANQQIAQAVEGASQSFAHEAAPTRTAAMVGAGLGGLFRQVMMDTGIISKDPAQEKAEKIAVAREALVKDAKDKGIELAKDPEGYTSLAVKHFMDAGMDDVAVKALQVGQVFTAQKRAAELDKSKIIKNIAGAEKDSADAKKTNAEADALPKLNAAKLEDLQTHTTLNKVRAQGLQVLTALKASDPNRAKVQRFNNILDGFEKRLAKDPNAKFTAGERKQLDELKGFDAINKLLSQTLGTDDGATSSTPPEHFDFTATP